MAYYQDGAGPCAGLPAEAAKKVRFVAPSACLSVGIGSFSTRLPLVWCLLLVTDSYTETPLMSLPTTTTGGERDGEAAQAVLWQVGARGPARQPLGAVQLYSGHPLRCGVQLKMWGCEGALCSGAGEMFHRVRLGRFGCASMHAVSDGRRSAHAVIGFNIMMWPFVFHTVLTIVELPQKRAAKKAL